ncbi:response regulator transcription factor [Duganella rivi]|uniref:response regulator transcription factor n=1 Tax=Duganella rivi TaxID=2666083 RepID=UPI00353090DC
MNVGPEITRPQQSVFSSPICRQRELPIPHHSPQVWPRRKCGHAPPWRASLSCLRCGDERTGFDLIPRLSKREAEVLACVAQGHTNPQIGALLGIATETVKSHLKNLLHKLGASNRTEAVMIATRHRLLEL